MTEAEGVALVDHSEGRKETVDWPTYLIVFLLGVGLLFPWNAVVLACVRVGGRAVGRVVWRTGGGVRVLQG
jgi:hypothetical protein